MQNLLPQIKHRSCLLQQMLQYHGKFGATNFIFTASFLKFTASNLHDAATNFKDTASVAQ